MPNGKTKKGLVAKVVFIFCILVLILVASGIFQQYMRRKELDTEVAGLKAELIRLNMAKGDFLKSIDAFSGDFFLEQEARLKFNMKKEGEKVVVIPLDDHGNPVGAVSPQSSASVSGGAFENFKDWWKYFFGQTS